MQAASKFIIIASSSAVLAVDQHAADERIRLEMLQQTLADAVATRMNAAALAHTEIVDSVALPATAHVMLSWTQLLAARQKQVHISIMCATCHEHKLSSVLKQA